MRRIPMLLMGVLLVGCVGAAGPTEQTKVEVAVAAAAPAQPAVPPALMPVFIETGSPHSDCLLNTGVGDPVHVVTDHNGLITLHVSAADSSFAPNVTYSCTDATGKAVKGATSPGVAADQPRLRAVAQKLPADARPLPALHGDLSAISDESLLARGYPPRPDASKTDAYAAWLQFVSHDNTFIPPHPVETPERHVINNPVGTWTKVWSGAVIEGPSTNQFVSVFGYWNVPGALPLNGIYQSFNKSDIPPSTVVTWVGLGGWNNNSLVQSGTDVNTGEVQNWATKLWSFYYTESFWNEWYPGYQTTLNFTVNANDSLQVHSWVGDDLGRLNVQGQFAWTYVINNTRNTATSNSFRAPTGTIFQGTSAEWIMETTGTLARYGTLTMPSSSFAQAQDGSIHQWFNEPFYWLVQLESADGQIWRNSVLNGLDVQDTQDPYSLHFQWKNP